MVSSRARRRSAVAAIARSAPSMPRWLGSQARPSSPAFSATSASTGCQRSVDKSAGSALQSQSDRRRHVPGVQASQFAGGGYPNRKLRPPRDSSGLDRLRGGPHQLSGRAGRRAASGQQLACRGMPGRADEVDGAVEPAVRGQEEPVGQVTSVDVLQRPVRGSRGKHSASAIQPTQPPRQPADVLVRTKDQPGARQQTATWVCLQHGELAAALGRRIVGVVVTCGVGVNDRGGLVGTERQRPAIHRPTGDIRVVADPVGQQRSAGLNDRRGSRPGIDCRIPLVICQRLGQLVGSRAVDVQCPRARSGGAADPSGHRGHVVAATQPSLDDGPTDMMRATQHQKPHPAII